MVEGLGGMSKTIKKIAGIVVAAALVVAGVVTANPQLIMAGIQVGAGLLAKRPKAPVASPASIDRLNASINPRTPRKIVFGRTAMATDIRDQEYSTDQTYLHRFVVVASHAVQSIEEIWFDDKLAWTVGGGVQGDFAGYLVVTPVLEGNAGNAINIGPRMGSSRRFTGCAYVYFRYKLTGNSKKTESPFAQSVPTRMTIIGKGAKVYDPRLDSTVPGGSGSQRANDQSTWTWNDNASRNPALQELFYLLGWRINGKLAVGKGMPPARIDLTSYMNAANLCDETVTKAAGGTEPRYRSDGVFSEGDDLRLVTDSFSAAMNGEIDDAAGKLRRIVLHNDLGSPVVDLTDDDVLGEFTWDQTAPLDDSFNVVRGTYPDSSAASLYQMVDYPQVRIASPDGIDRIETVDLGLVQSPSQCQRLAKQRVARMLYSGTFTGSFSHRAWKADKGSVVRLSFRTLGWTNKLFRVAEATTQVDGVSQLVLREEHPDIYLWDNEEAPEVQAAEPTRYDPLLSPIYQDLVAAGNGAGPGFAVVTSAGIALTGIKLSRTAAYTGSWNQGWRSVESYLGGASLTIRVLDSQWLETFFGLNDDPAADDDYVGINYSLQLSYSSGSRYVYLRDGASNVWTSPTGFFADGDVFNIHYNGRDVRFTRNGVPFGPAISAAAGQRLFMDGSNASANGTAAFAELVGFTAAGPAGVDGVPGSAGAPGAPGANGVTHYNWIAFADSPDGAVNFTTGAPNGRAYRGEAVNMTTATESTNPADYVWSQYTGPRGFGVVSSSGLQLAGDRLIRTAPYTGAWDQGWYSSESFTGGCSVSGRLLTTTGTLFMLGLNSDPTADNNYTSLDHAIYVDWGGGAGQVSAFENGSPIWSSSAGFIGVGDVISIHYDGKAVRYAKNGTVFYTNTTVAAGLTFWMDGSVAAGNGTEPFLQLLSFNGAGAVGATGAAGVPGSPGAPGATIYTHYAYADSSDGQINFGTGSPNGRTWQGVRYNQTSPVESTNPADYTWSPYTGPAAFGLAASSGAEVSGNKLVRKTAYTGAWDQQIYSTEGFYQGATVRFKPLAYAGYMGGVMVGLNTDPTSGDWTTLDHAFYLESTSSGVGVIYIAESGGLIATGWNYDASYIFTIVYDNDRVRYYANGTLLRDVDVAADITFYMDSAIQVPGPLALLLDFSPLGKRGADGSPGAPGSPGSPGAPGANAISPELSSYSVTVPCFSDGSVKPGGLDAATGTFRLRSGGTLITSGIGFAVLAATSGSSATIDGSGNFAVTGLGSAEPVEITLRASYGGNNFDLKYTVTKARSGTNATANSVNVTGNIPNSTTYDVVQTVDLSVPAGNYIDGTASGSYDPPYGGSSVSYTCIPTFKLTVQNLTDGGAAVQIGSEVNGTAAQWFAEDVSGNSGSLSGISGSGQNTTGAAKTFRLTLWAKRTSGNAGAGFTSGSLSIGARA